jgi:hypothetical protein
MHIEGQADKVVEKGRKRERNKGREKGNKDRDLQ